MVKSGLKEEDLVNNKEPRVSPYRLTSHLGKEKKKEQPKNL